MNTAKIALQGLSVGQPASVRNLTVFPLLAHETRVANYLLLADAIANGLVTISEVSEAGSVPVLLLDNRADRPVLLLDGDHLVGCKQNRVLNVSVLAPAGAKTAIPVSCVEQGRWRSESSQFDVSDRAMYAELRAAKVEQVSASLSGRRGFHADQSAIWDGIESKSRRMGSASPSGAMAGVFGRHGTNVDFYVRHLPSSQGQCGGVFAINGRIVGLELLDAQSSWAKCCGSVTSGYALDAVDHVTDLFEPATQAAVDTFLGRLADATEAHFHSIGLGEDVRIEAYGLAGAALTCDGRVVHLCAFDLGRPFGGARNR